MEIEKTYQEFEKSLPEFNEESIFCYSPDEYNNFLDKKIWKKE